MKTYQAKKNLIQRAWHLMDAKDQVLGRLATRVASLLVGKGKRTYTPHVDCGDFVVIINAEGIRITGDNKPIQKIDFRHSGYPGGYTITPYDKFLKEHPDRAVFLSISGMISKTRLRKRQLARLRVFKSDKHPHGAQFAVKKTEKKGDTADVAAPTNAS
ncbi:MAG: 50S ribosomal protein L13 [Elusimicrobia bacterium]|nr:50S ribosomal protein L13 [Candidatus Obscuribacterium magneticum]